MWAVTLTDFVQFAVLVTGMVVLTPVLLHDMGGWSFLAVHIPAERFHLYPRGSGELAYADRLGM